MAFTQCVELIDKLSNAETIESLHSICSDVCSEYGFDLFIYGARFPTSFVNPHFVFISGYPKEWRDRYTANSYMVIDPTVQYCAQNIIPLQWDQVSLSHNQTTEIKRFMSEAGDFGVRSGVSFPVHSVKGDFAMFTLASEKPNLKSDIKIQCVMPFGHLFSAHLHEAVRKIFESDVISLSRCDLTRREKECLLWVTEGKTAWETSKILNISERTVTFHLQNVQEKLGVTNRQHAVARAVALGIVEPQFN